MANLSSESYLAIKPEVTVGTAVIPNIFIPLISESISLDPSYEADRRMKGVDWKSDDILRGARNYTGELVVWADPDTLGHLLNMVMEKGDTTGDGTNGYTHPFTIGTPKSYTIEIKKGDSVRRYFGVKGRSLSWEFVDGKIQATISIGAMGHFSIGTLKTAISEAVTEIELDTQYDLEPVNGLVIGDKLEIGGTEVTISGFDGNTKVQFVSTVISASAGDPVKLVPQTPSYDDIVEPFLMGNVLIGVGADETAATTAAGSRATATPFYSFTVNLGVNLLDAPASGRIDPIQLLQQTKEAQISASQLMESQEQYQAWVERTKQAITYIAKGQPIGSGQETFQVKFYKVKQVSLEEPLDIETYIYDNSEFEVLHDATDGAIDISLTNRTPGTSY